MDIVKDPMYGDKTLEKDGLKVFIEKAADMMLANATIDFVSGQGFVINGMQGSSCC